MNLTIGIERDDLLNDVLSGRRLGVLTTSGATTRDGTPSVDLLVSRFDVRILFGPEHGVRGTVDAGQHVPSGTDPGTGLPVRSLYGERRAPEPEDLSAIDLMVVDLPDVGSRYYTYLSTLSLTMEACARAAVPVVVLDRPNPVSGAIVEGTRLREQYASFVGLHPVPARHGLTIAEYASWLITRLSAAPELITVPMAGWQRSDFWAATGRRWHRPSPNLPTPESAIAYVGTCLFEGTNVSEGRGTDRPFQLIGAPWLRPHDVLEQADAWLPAGAAYHAAAFEPAASKHAGQRCHGITIEITNPRRFRPYRAGVVLLDAIRRLHPEFVFREPDAGGRFFVDLLAGDDEIRGASFSIDAYLERAERESLQFRCERAPLLLYR